MVDQKLRNKPIRAGVVLEPKLGYLLAGDLKKDDDEIPYTMIVKWKDGKFTYGSAEYTAFTCCGIDLPEYGYVDVGWGGYYGVQTRRGVTAGNIFEDSQPAPSKPRLAEFRTVNKIAGKAHVVGLRGMVYRLDHLEKWTRIDEGLPETFDGRAIAGFDESDIYAVGRHGSLWHHDGKKWSKQELPTNRNLTTVLCAGDGQIYIGGHGGILLRGRLGSWELVEHDATESDFWDLEWFKGAVYASTLHGVYSLNADNLEPADFGDDPPKTFYILSAVDDVIWSIGRKDVMAYDSKNWTRIL